MVISFVTCDVDDANIKMPENLVNVMPDKTLEPNTDSALLARASFVPTALLNARTMCEMNSTPMPMLCTIDSDFSSITQFL